MKVLVADDDDSLRFFMQELIQEAGYQFVAASDADSALALFSQEQPDLVLLDAKLGDRSGLDVLRRVRDADPTTIIVLVTGFGSEELAVEALRLRADNYLLKPIRHESLKAMLRKYGELVTGLRRKREIQHMVVRREMSLSLDNRMELVSSAAAFLAEQVTAFFPRETISGISLGLGELIMNAIEHGNLEINFTEKRRLLELGPERLNKVLGERAKDPVLGARRVTIDFQATTDKCEWVIRDEGPGFNPDEIPDPLEDGIEEVNGRGIFLARFQFDELQYIGRANRVRAMRHIAPGGPVY